MKYVAEDLFMDELSETLEMMFTAVIFCVAVFITLMLSGILINLC